MTADAVTVSTVVAVTPAVAFQVFCGEIDRWWRRNPTYRKHTDSVVHFVEQPTRRLVEVSVDGSLDLGEVTRWEPPNLLRMDWRLPVGVEPGSSNTVEVRFDPVEAGTRVTVTHSMGATGVAAGIVGLWWSNPLVDFRAACNAPEAGS